MGLPTMQADPAGGLQGLPTIPAEPQGSERAAHHRGQPWTHHGGLVGQPARYAQGDRQMGRRYQIGRGRGGLYSGLLRRCSPVHARLDARQGSLSILWSATLAADQRSAADISVPPLSPCAARLRAGGQTPHGQRGAFFLARASRGGSRASSGIRRSRWVHRAPGRVTTRGLHAGGSSRGRGRVAPRSAGRSAALAEDGGQRLSTGATAGGRTTDAGWSGRVDVRVSGWPGGMAARG